MNDLYSPSDLRSDIRENGYLVKSEQLEGGVRLVTIESTREAGERTDPELPEFLRTQGPETDIWHDLVGRIQDALETPEKMAAVGPQLHHWIRQLGREADVHIRGVCETDGATPETPGDALIYISRSQEGGTGHAQAVTESILKQIDAYRTK